MTPASPRPTGPSLRRVPKVLILGPDPSNRWDLPADADLGAVRDALWAAMDQGEIVATAVTVDGQAAELLVDGRKLAAAAVVEVPQQPKRTTQFLS